MLAALILLCAAAAGDEAAVLRRHEGPMEKVLAEAKESGRTILLDFYTDW